MIDFASFEALNGSSINFVRGGPLPIQPLSTIPESGKGRGELLLKET